MKKVILITGVSSGFGRATAKLLALAGHKVYGTVRSDTAPIENVGFLRMDLTDFDSIRTAVSAIKESEGRIDVLINNAGMHTGGSCETLPMEFVKKQIDTNFTGMVAVTREVLPLMRENGGGTLINFSSIGGLMGLPFQGYYSAAKFATEGFSEALRMEVKRFNIKVVLINPGDFHTSNSANRRSFLTPSTSDDPYSKQFEKTLKVIEHDEGNGWQPEVLAAKLVKIVQLKSPRHRYIIASFEQKLAVLLKYILPGRLFAAILEGHYLISGKDK